MAQIVAINIGPVRETPATEQWYPVLTTVPDGERDVLQVSDWTGGTGDKPATGQYVGETGLVTDIADAINVAPAPVAPVVSAGADQSLPAADTSCTLTGSATPGEGSTITGYSWSVAQAPEGNTPVIATPAAASTLVTGLVPGTYRFQLIALASNGTAASDQAEVKIAVPARLYNAGAYSGAQEVYIYEPEGYDPTVPSAAVLGLHAAGANGSDIEAILTMEDAGHLYLANAGRRFDTLLVMPQRAAGNWPDDDAANTALQFAQGLVNIDPNRVSVAGFSSGGGGALQQKVAHPAQYALVKAVSSVFSGAEASPAAFGTGTLKLYHGMQDTDVPVNGDGTTWEVATTIDGLSSGKPSVGPEVSLSFEDIHSAGAMNDLAFDPDRAAFDPSELLCNLDPAVEATNYVTRAAARDTFKDYAVAAWKVSKLPAGSQKTALQGQLATIAPNNTYFINLGSEDAAFAPYVINNAPNLSNGTSLSALKSIKNETSGLGFGVVSGGGAAYTAGRLASLFGLSPQIVSTGLSLTTSPGQTKITGIPSGKYLDIFVFYSDKSTDKTNISGFYITANGAAQGTTRQAPWNSQFTVDLLNVPEIGGEVTLTAASLNSAGGTIIGIAFQVKDTGTALWTSRWAFRETPAVISGWNVFTAEPSSGIRTLADTVNGITMSTVATGADFWQNFAFTYYHKDDEGPDVDTYPSWMTKQVGRGALYNYSTSFKRAIQNFNLKWTKEGGFDEGLYRLRVFGSTSNNANNSNAYYLGQVGNSGINSQRLEAYNNTGRWLEFIGEVNTRHQKIQLASHIGPAGGLAFINAITLEQLK